MKTVQVTGRKTYRGCWIMVFLLLASWDGIASSEILPVDRRVTWQGNVGVSGDIPNRTTIRNCVTSDGAHADGADTRDHISTCLANTPSGGVAYLPAGTYSIASAITIPVNKSLRGAGMGVTTIAGLSGASKLIQVGSASGIGAAVNISSGNTKGSTTVTTSTAHGLSVGNYVIIDQLDCPSCIPTITNVGNGGTCGWCSYYRPGRTTGQSNKVVGIPSSTQVTLEIPLYWTYQMSQTPQIMSVSFTSGAGLEDLTVNNSTSGAQYAVVFDQVANSWFYRVEVISTAYQIVRVFGSYRNTIRGCKFHEGNPTSATSGSAFGPSRGYGIKFEGLENSGNLIENNIFYHHSMAVADEGPFSGNVIAYNYVTNMYHYSSATAGESLSALHGAHPFMNLWEGNYSNGKYNADNYWGSSSNNTLFRNRIINEVGFSSNNYIIDLNSKGHYNNIVGNVLGTVGIETVYEYENADHSGTNKVIYSLGYTTAGDTGASGNDPSVKTTLYRHGNWDSVNNAIVWDSSNADHAIPTSLYLLSKPSWWCIETPSYPPIGPDVSPMASSIPAKIIYEGGACSYSQGGGGGGGAIHTPMPPVIIGIP